MRIAIDTSFLLLDHGSGMKTYTRDLVLALLETIGPDELLCWYNVFRPAVTEMPHWPDPGVSREVVCRFPRRVLESSWKHMHFPPVEWMTGRLDVFHSVHLQVPPTRSARTVLTVHDLREFRLPHLYPHLQRQRAWRRQ
ncbi:MAG: hypothetical protein ACYCW6_25225, partial [Candidatus Xenobia bacterium]